MDIIFYNTKGKLIRKFKDVDYKKVDKLQRNCKPCGCWYDSFTEKDEKLTWDNDGNIKYIKVEGTIEDCRELMFWSGLAYNKSKKNFSLTINSGFLMF